ncbi:DUF7351 domain-containing protein [Natronobeatus ordinarius]|uniref:DUF7351 domain-containing protein n=1 Tax=Natronobeatus ordinarius TaxID=2963433 RepID=UPI0020CF2903|nr:ArsR family transcriptional regulator [Natronobeatus ordinarius]
MPDSNDVHVDQEVIDAIGSLGNRTRLEIMLALAEAEREHRTQSYAMSFTDLYRAVDVDSTSQFSYHLTRLVGRFVAETEDGYHLTYAGSKVVRAVLSGSYESAPDFGTVEVAGVCVFCEAASLVATQDDDLLVVRCTACDSPLVTDSLSRSQARNRTPSEIVTSSGYRIWGSAVQLRGDVCPECHGRVDTVLEEHELDGRSTHLLASTCPECWLVLRLPLEIAAAFHPAAIGFFWDHGVSLLDLTLWEVLEYVTSGALAAEVESVDPTAATIELTLDEETLRLRMDETLTITPT